MRSSRSGRQSGQALVESALTLPLLLFVVLGTLQLFLALQARSLAEYAAFRAARAGSLNNGDCNRMVHAAIAALVPSFTTFLGPATPGATPGQKLANAFRAHAGNKYSPGVDGAKNDGTVVWIAREQPLKDAIPQDEDREFDLPGYGGFRLEARLVYWYPMHIPFANWVMARMFLAHWALTPYTAVNPLMPAKYANWPSGYTGSLNFFIGQELQTRIGNGEYVLPIDTNYSMRMMTPAKQKFFQKQHCDPTPQGLTP